MSILRDVLDEERERLLNIIDLYEKKLKDLPAGSISIKTINGKKYAYILYRKKEKVCTEYIGLSGSDKVRETKELIKQRKKYQRLLKQAKDNLKEVQRFFRGKK